MTDRSQVIRGVIDMEESVTYQAIIEKGMVRGMLAEARRLVWLLGEKHFGPAEPDVKAALEAIEDILCLERLVLSMETIGSWRELLVRSAYGGFEPAR